MPANSALAPLAALINRALQLDPLAARSLQALANNRLGIHCTEPALDVVLQINPQGIELLAADQLPVNCQLTGSLSAFVRLLNSDDKAAAIINSDVQLRGNSQLLIDLERIFRQLDLDWEYQLAKLIGDLPAHLLGKLGRESQRLLQLGQPILARHLQEFMVEEARLVPARAEIEQFIEQVQDLQLRSERLAARIQRLAEQRPPKALS